MRLSVVMPVLDEAGCIRTSLERLRVLREAGHEVIVADGGSRDGTPDLARGLADCILDAPRGRALQMNAGAARAGGDVLLFLHADTRLPADVLEQLAAVFCTGSRRWGRFDVRIEGRHPMLRVVARAMNLRSRLTSVCTGDQCIVVARELFVRAEGYPPIVLMEDVALSKRLRRLGAMAALPGPVVTSGRRWENNGVWRTIVLMWWLRLRYFLGDSPRRLGRVYEAGPR
ncbi:MAG: TIGR04283 family arsenosugar biosynthesis glycosyltransferase [Burkholderiales bacterium]|nr:TIGR04283 family arsenosugar biosynthesis glycosyltransferase [Burkholderiales bacterium]